MFFLQVSRMCYLLPLCFPVVFSRIAPFLHFHHRDIPYEKSLATKTVAELLLLSRREQWLAQTISSFRSSLFCFRPGTPAAIFSLPSATFSSHNCDAVGFAVPRAALLHGRDNEKEEEEKEESECQHDPQRFLFARQPPNWENQEYPICSSSLRA